MKTIKTYEDFITQRVITWIYDTAGQDLAERKTLIVTRLRRLDLTDEQLALLMAEIRVAFNLQKNTEG